MIVTAARLHPYALPLRAPWKSAAGGFTVRAGCLLRLDTDSGHCGYGDYAPLGQPAPQALAQQALALCGQPVDSAMLALEAAGASSAPAIRCAIECALLDLLAQSAGKTLAGYLSGHLAGHLAEDPGSSGTAQQVAVNAALGSLAEIDAAAVHNACREGFTVLKIKVGCAAPAEEIAQLHALARLLPESVRLRLDANGAWPVDVASTFLQACAGLPIEHCEEALRIPPEAAGDGLLQLAKLQAASAIALAVDESWSEKIAEDFFRLRPANRIILKPTRLGGLLPALTLARRAARQGVASIVTSSLDSACGILAAAQLAAALGNTLAHGLATSCWLRADTGAAPPIASGMLTLPAVHGLGFQPCPGLDFPCASIAASAKG